MPDTSNTDGQSINLDSSLITRSNVPDLSVYSDYREYLRSDFYFSCGYCTMSEVEAQGISFEIDHYEPTSARPDLENKYDNLIYSCSECNSTKSDLSPPEEARRNGYEFFRPDRHVWEDNFASSGIRLIGIGKIGEFTVTALRLNRESLRRLRGLRERLHECDITVARGIVALRSFRLDQLPPTIRANAHKAVNQVTQFAEHAAESVDEILKSAARSPLLNNDYNRAFENNQRTKMLDEAKTLFPGKWQGRKYKAERKNTHRPNI